MSSFLGIELSVLPWIELAGTVIFVFYLAGWAWKKGTEKSK